MGDDQEKAIEYAANQAVKVFAILGIYQHGGCRDMCRSLGWYHI